MRKIDPFHYGRIEKDEVNQQAVQNYFQLIDEAEAFYNATDPRVVEQMGGGQDRATVICLSGRPLRARPPQRTPWQGTLSAAAGRQWSSRWTIFIWIPSRHL